jgi:hypothetical protein
MKILLCIALLVCAQLHTQARPHTSDSIPARISDVGSIDSIITALYNVISGAKDEPRNWDRMRTLFRPEAMMVPTGRKGDGKLQATYISVEDYIKIVGPNLVKLGFFEKEIGRKVHQYGHIAEVFSTYESQNNLTDAKPFMRGINSIQLWNDGKRWWIMSIMWQGETPENPIPADMVQ